MAEPDEVLLVLQLAQAFATGKASVAIYDKDGTGEHLDAIDRLVCRLVVAELVGLPAEDVKDALLAEVAAVSGEAGSDA